MTPIDVCLIGNASLALEAARALRARGHRVLSFAIADPDLARLAREDGFAVGPVQACDYLLSVANLKVIDAETLALARRGAVNFHDGPLPERAGLNAPVWALIEGAQDHAITWHRIEAGIDEGPVLLRVPVPIQPGDTALTLNARCWEVAVQSLPDLLSLLERGEDRGTPQPHPPLRRHMRVDRPAGGAVLDFGRDAASQARLVRALDHGPYWNPLLRPKLRVGDALWLVSEAEVMGPCDAPAGTVLAAQPDSVTVACADGQGLRLSGLATPDGASGAHGVVPGQVLPSVGPDAALDGLIRNAARDEPIWRRHLATLAPVAIPEARDSDQAADWQPLTLEVPEGACASTILAAVTGAVARMTGSTGFDMAVCPELAPAMRPHVLPWLPLSVETEGLSLQDLARQLQQALADLHRRGPILIDLPARAPELSRPDIPGLVVAADPALAPHGAALCLTLPSSDATGATLWHDRHRLSRGAAEALRDVCVALLGADPAVSLAEATTLLQGQAPQVMRNDDGPADPDDTIIAAFDRQVARTPDAPALVFAGETLSYRQLDGRTRSLAGQLAAMGVGPGRPVGIFAPRGLGLVIGALAILRAGGAYVPLDPTYPSDRIAHYLADSQAPVVLCDPSLVDRLPAHRAQVLTLDAQGPQTDPTLPSAADLAYLIYTSGSTGTPKGVMVEHRNVINFFAGMDATIPQGSAPGTWLAVTSLSFDISVLEIFWTLTRGWKVVIAGDVLGSGDDARPVAPGDDASRQGTQFSLFYWGNDDGAGPRKYELLLEGARFADQYGFAAVWTPERHFHAFGGPYPNPAVTGAAVAAVTRSIAVRAGSCVAPLHHPARIAEEWAVIDNLTNGRAGLAIASGWQPDDFVLRPENAPPNNKAAMARSIEQLRRLWRGEAVEFPRADGTPFAVVTQPRPVSAELPIWVTTAGNPETWREAGRLGANVLTHLLGQSVQDIAARIPDYHAALREAGHDPSRFTVTLMLHSYLADSREEAMEAARVPMKDYLRAAAGLVKQYAWAFPAFKKPAGVSDPMAIDLSSLSDEEMEGILDFAFLRYFNDSGLFGTVEDAVARVEELHRIGVSEIACLIDYGIPTPLVLQGLERLAKVHDRVNPARTETQDYSIAAQIRRHGVTHLQATPSMARLLLEDAATRQAMAGLRVIALGGEALSPGLLSDLRQASGAQVLNMYGPTETTIWSAVADLGLHECQVRLGGPIAGTSLHLRDACGRPVADGVAAELWIGGAGVTRGYWNRPEQTAAAFPTTAEGRLYRTGDLCRRDSQGALHFLGRVDQQVKLRGYRIELGEIEARLAGLPGVQEVAVVIRQDDAGERQLTGIVTGPGGLDPQDLRMQLRRSLPDFMVPQRIHVLPAMPLTPNRKIDRKALATMELEAPAHPVASPVQPAVIPAPPPAATEAPQDANAMRQAIARLMARVLGLPSIAPQDNFFAMGGHSLLAVQLHRALRDELGLSRSAITDIFRFPVLADLSAHLTGASAPKPAPAPLAAPTEGPAAATASDLIAARRALRARMRPSGSAP